VPYKKIKKVQTTVVNVVVTKATTVTEVKPSNHVQRSKDLLKHLNKHFAVFQKYQPLVIGVNKELCEIFPELSKRVVNTALHLHTQSKKYLKNVAKGQDRVNLCGQFMAKTDKVSIKQAKQTLAKLFKK
jgi:sRNA-binding protein